MSRYHRRSFDIISYAGNAEDVVLMRAFRDRPGGFFVDVGAGEPDVGSLTKNLVERLGWCGVNIEPLPEPFERLEACRPSDVNLQVGIDQTPGRAVLHRIVGCPAMSTLDASIADMHRQRGWQTEELEIEVVTLASVLAAHAGPGFDLLKVDAEGREAAVLASADLRAWRPRAVVIEATVPNTTTPSHDAWEPRLLDTGYVLTLFDGINRFYVRADEPELVGRMSAPANELDRWIPAGWAELLGHQV